MKNEKIIFIASSIFLLLTSGCIIRTYSVVKERPDLEIEGTGNQGYLVGSPSETKEVEKKTRTTYVAEVEVGVSEEEKALVEKHRQEKAVRKAKKSKKVSQASLSTDKSISEEAALEEGYASSEEAVVVVGEQSVRPAVSTPAPTVQKVKVYVVKDNDTLEKIAARPEVYGDKKKWYKIYKANESKLKEPNRIFPGQVLNIPE